MKNQLNTKFFAIFFALAHLSFAGENPTRRCNEYGTLVSRNGDIEGKDNPAEYTCYRWEYPNPYFMQDNKYNCCSGWVQLRNPKDSWRSDKFDCGTGEKAYNWDRWDVYCD